MLYFKSLRLRNKLLLGFSIPALLTIGLSIFILKSVNRMDNAFQWVEHTHKAISYGDSLLAAMIDMETGLRGFLVAGDTVFLEPYDQGKAAFETNLEAVRNHVSDNQGQLDRLSRINADKTAWLAEHAKPAIALRNSVEASTSSNITTMSDVATFIGKGLGKKSMDDLREKIADFIAEEQHLIELRSEEKKTVTSITNWTVIIGALITLISSIVAVLLITRSIGNQLGTEPGTVEKIAKSIANGDLSQDLTTDKPARGVFAAMQTMQENLKNKFKEDKHLNEEMARLKQALDCASSPVLVADDELKVIYQNRAAMALFTTVEKDIKGVNQNFSAGSLIGSNATVLHTNESMSGADIKNLTKSHKEDLVFNKITLQRILSPIIDEGGERIGTVMEWNDETDQLLVEQEIQSVVEATLQGDLSKRLELDNKQGFFLLLGERMNALISVCESVLGDTVRVFNAMSEYDLTQKITADYDGSFSELKEKANQTIVQLTKIVGDVKTDASMLDKSSSALHDINQQMHTTAETSSGQATVVSNAVEQISANISGVASASTQMSASINEIARNSSNATQIAREAVSLAESTETTVRKLSTSSNDIGDVIKVINSIAEQTNLLALNATIEAARAGDAGKGFAVVANEVKDLAKETAKATEEISQKIATIQTDSESAVTAIGGIDETIKKINDIQIMIASAVEEQTATTNEITRSVNEAADGGADIAENSAQAANGALQALTNSKEAQLSTNDIASFAAELSSRMEQFRVDAA